MKTVVLSNPHSRRARRHFEALGAAPGLIHEVTEAAADVGPTIARHGLGPADVLVFNGGDGTVQDGLTRLLAEQGIATLPTIAILPGGTTNMTALDLNRSRSFRASLRTLSEGRVRRIERSVVAVSSGATRHYGFFFGAGSIVHGIRYFHEQTEIVGIGSALAMARALWGLYRRQAPYGEAVEITIGRQTEARFLVFVTSLNRLINGTKPYWGVGPGVLKMTAVQHDAKRLLRSIPRALTGRAPRAHGYQSTNLDRVRMQFDGPYTLDGEMFESRGQELDMSAETLRIWPL